MWFVRHGQSASNAGEVTFDPAAIPLTPLGLVQAAQLGRAGRGRGDRAPAHRHLALRPCPADRRTAGQPVFPPGVPVETWPVQEFTYLNPTACVGTGLA